MLPREMAKLQGFWSYVHADDQADGGRIADLARDVVAQFEMLTGEPIALFLDEDSLKWGDQWQSRIDSSLESVAFFIAVLTPRYFRSAECRRELQFFARRSSQRGLRELVLPLLYVDVPALADSSTEDDLVKVVQSFQWEDWRDLRFAERDSEAYRRTVSKLANRLVEANRQAEISNHIVSSHIPPDDHDHAEDEPAGVLDRMALAEEAMPKWSITLDAITAEIQAIGEVMQETADEVRRSDQNRKGFAGRTYIAKKTARRLGEPVDRLVNLGNEFTSQLHDVDEGIRTIISEAAAEIEREPESLAEFCSLFFMTKQLVVAARDGLAMTQTLIDSLAPMERLSRDLRPPVRRLREALTVLVEGREVMAEWIHLIAATQIDCSSMGEGDNHADE